MFAKSVCSVLALGVASVFAAPVSAATTIDFTNAQLFGSVADTNPFVANVVGIGDVELTSVGGAMTFNAGSFAAPAEDAFAQTLAQDGDGIGIVDDEINGKGESLVVTFLGEAQGIIGISLLDLFPRDERSAEKASIEFFGAGDVLLKSVVFQASTPRAAGGWLNRVVSVADVESIRFTGLTPTAGNTDNATNDYALAAIQVGAVPETSTWILMLAGFGLTGFVLKRRQRVPAAA